MPIEKLDLEEIKRDLAWGSAQVSYDMAQKINEIIDFLSVPQCPHDYLQGTSGFVCRKCGQIKL